jgi:hypothetical protein
MATLERQEASPYGEVCQIMRWTSEGSSLTITLFLFDFSGATAGRGGMGGASTSALDFSVEIFEVDSPGFTDKGGVDAP